MELFGCTLGRSSAGAAGQQQDYSKHCPSTASALFSIMRAASDVLIFSFFPCRKKNGPGMRTKCLSCMIPFTGKITWDGTKALMCHTSTLKPELSSELCSDGCWVRAQLGAGTLLQENLC